MVIIFIVTVMVVLKTTHAQSYLRCYVSVHTVTHPYVRAAQMSLLALVNQTDMKNQQKEKQSIKVSEY